LIPKRCLVIVLALLDERRQPAAPGPCEPRVEQPDGDLEGDAVDLAELLGDQVGAVGRLVGLLDLGELDLLAVGQVVRVLPQREEGALEVLRGLLVAGLAGFVPDLAADLVERVGSELDDVEWVHAPDRVRAPLADRRGDRLGHVTRDQL
jgi:hypothetical protein